MKVDYILEKDEFMFSYLMKNGGIIFDSFDYNFTDSKNYIYKFKECESIYGYSVLYLNNSNNYYILSDTICSGVDYPFEKL